MSNTDVPSKPQCISMQEDSNKCSIQDVFSSQYDYNELVGKVLEKRIAQILREIGFVVPEHRVSANGVDVEASKDGELDKFEMLNLNRNSYIGEDRAKGIDRNLGGARYNGVFIPYPQNISSTAKIILEDTPICYIGFQILPSIIHNQTNRKHLKHRRLDSERTFKLLKNIILSFLHRIGLVPLVYNTSDSIYAVSDCSYVASDCSSTSVTSKPKTYVKRTFSKIKDAFGSRLPKRQDEPSNIDSKVKNDTQYNEVEPIEDMEEWMKLIEDYVPDIPQKETRETKITDFADFKDALDFLIFKKLLGNMPSCSNCSRGMFCYIKDEDGQIKCLKHRANLFLNLNYPLFDLNIPLYFRSKMWKMFKRHIV